MVLEIYIVGAGLGGLSAAIACAVSGHRVTVLERAPELAEIGAGLQLGPNATSILYEYDLGPGLEDCWVEPLQYTIHRYSDGKVLCSVQDWDVKMRQKYGAPFVNIHRGQLQLLMYRRALAKGVHFILGETVRSIDPVTSNIVTESGKSYSGDLVVGCDGLWSVSRESLLGRTLNPEPTGDLAYRITLTLDQVADEDLQDMIKTPACRLWIGPKSHVVAYSLKSGQQFNVVLLVPNDLPAQVHRQIASLDEMRALFHDWDPTLTRILDCVGEAQKWKLLHLQELDTWRNEQGNFILLGDSCHPMLPYLAQGASSAIEDGAVLGKILESVNSCNQLPQATKLWQELRKERSEFMVKESSAQRDAFHMENGPEQRERDLILESCSLEEPKEGFPSRWVDPKVQRFIFGYKAIAEVMTAANKLTARVANASIRTFNQ